MLEPMEASCVYTSGSCDCRSFLWVSIKSDEFLQSPSDMDRSHFHLIFKGDLIFVESLEMMSRICFLVKSKITRRIGSWKNPS